MAIHGIKTLRLRPGLKTIARLGGPAAEGNVERNVRMPRKNRIVVTKADVARVLAIVDSHRKWPHRRIHHHDLRKALEQARIVAPEEVPADVVTLDSDVRVRNRKTGIAT